MWQGDISWQLFGDYTVDVCCDGCMIISNHISSLAIVLLMYAVIAARWFSKQHGKSNKWVEWYSTVTSSTKRGGGSIVVAVDGFTVYPSDPYVCRQFPVCQVPLPHPRRLTGSANRTTAGLDIASLGLSVQELFLAGLVPSTQCVYRSGSNFYTRFKLAPFPTTERVCCHSS